MKLPKPMTAKGSRTSTSWGPSSSLMNQFLDQQRPENESFQDLKAVSSPINKVLLVGAKPGYYGDPV